MAAKKILVTGGTGYIGSFTTLELLGMGFDVVIVDNLYNSDIRVLDRIELLSGGKRPHFYNVDVTDFEALNKVFDEHPDISSAIHFAALKAVGESAKIPTEYYRVNLGGAINLLRAMQSHNAREIIFSSSATVYGDATRFPNMIPIPENCPLDPTNPYGRTKFFIEEIIADHVKANPGEWSAAILRYFNPAGAHPSGIMGEDPQGVPYNLLPLLGQVAIGKRPYLSVFGDDYDSKDGTPIRDYIHIVDLAKGHLAALRKLAGHLSGDDNKRQTGIHYWNLGTGKGSTVFDILHAFSKVVGKELPYKVEPRRQGDVLNLTADPRKANKELEWHTQLTLQDACDDLWRWVSNNPQGYRQDFPEKLDPRKAL